MPKTLDKFKDDSKQVLAERRAALKRRIARARIWQLDFSEKQRVVNELERKIEHGLPSDYEVRVLPLRTELEKLEDRDIQLRIDGKPADKKTEARQAELRHAIDEAGEGLDAAITSAEQTFKRLERELETFSEGIRENVPDVLVNELAGLVSPEKLLRRHVLSWDLKSQVAREKGVVKSLSDVRHHAAVVDMVTSSRDKASFQRQIKHLEAVVKFASESRAAAQEAVEEFRKECLED